MKSNFQPQFVERRESSISIYSRGSIKELWYFSPYTRFNKNEGNFAIEKQFATPEIVAKL